HLQEGVLPGIFEDPEVPKDAYVKRRYCRIRKESGLWHIYYIGPTPVDKETAEAAENEHAEVLLRQPFFGTYVRVLPDGAGYDCYDTMSISSYSLSSHRKSLFNEAVREDNGDMLFSYTLEDVTYQTMRVHPDTSEDGRVMTITVTEFRDGSPSEVLQYERNDFYEKNITGIYASASTPGKDFLMVDEYGRAKMRGSVSYLVGKNADGGSIRLLFCDENGHPTGTEAYYLPGENGAPSIRISENGEDETFVLLQDVSSVGSPLAEVHRAFTEEKEMYISRSEGTFAGQALSCKNCANFAGYLYAAASGGGAYLEVDCPAEITGSVVSYWGSDPEIRVSTLEDYDLILYENHGEKHAYINVSYAMPNGYSYNGAGFRSLYDEAEFYTLLGFAPGEEIVIPDRGQDALSAAEEYCELYEKTVASVSPGSKCALAFCDVTVRAWDRNTGEAAESVDESADSCDLLYEYLWACDTEQSYRWHIPGGTFAYLGSRTDVPGNTWQSGIFAVIKREADGWHLDLRGGTF
ncbi:MAG: hypothetical protein IKR59_08625, partial [Lachnospiraceae bacterium]|nr:hypothetical protein [Lachnospiraceae bacterium]